MFFVPDKGPEGAGDHQTHRRTSVTRRAKSKQENDFRFSRRMETFLLRQRYRFYTAACCDAKEALELTRVQFQP